MNIFVEFRNLYEKFLRFDWLRAVAFQLNLKYLHVKITNLLPVLHFQIIVFLRLNRTYVKSPWIPTSLLPLSFFFFFIFIFYLVGGLTDSAIVGNDVNYLTHLSTWLKPVAQSKSSRWKRCWRASVDGWAVSTFHSRCDNKGPTVTVIRVGGKYIFGGYTSLSWGKWFIFSKTGHISM